jgi:hypothetical protein
MLLAAEAVAKKLQRNRRRRRKGSPCQNEENTLDGLA